MMFISMRRLFEDVLFPNLLMPCLTLKFYKAKTYITYHLFYIKKFVILISIIVQILYCENAIHTYSATKGIYIFSYFHKYIYTYLDLIY